MSVEIVNSLLRSFNVVAPEAILIVGACVLFVGGTVRSGRNLWGVAALVSLLAAMVGLALTCPLCSARPTDSERIAALVEQLGVEPEAKKMEAASELEKIGLPALAELRGVRDDRGKDLLVRDLARQLIERIELRAAPGVFATSLRFDHLTRFVKSIALLGGVLLVLLSWKEFPDAVAAECFACLLLVVAGLSLVGAANDLITLFIALEMISIPSYILLYLPRHDDASQEAAMKYFLLSVFSSALLLFGFSYLYGLAGTTNLPAIAEALGSTGGGASLIGLTALVMIVAGLGFKIAAVPFHFYAPDVYQGTPTSNAALLAFVPKAAGFIALIRVLAFVPAEAVGPEGAGVIDNGVRHPGLILGGDALTLLWILAAVTMTLGNLLALLQDNLKRMLAYSSVAHAGYMLIGLTVAAAQGTRGTDDVGGVEALLFYLVAYAGMTLGAFGVLIYLSTPQRSVEKLDDLAGLSRSHPGVAAMMAVFLFSLIGIPFTAGFMGKFFLFFGAIGVAQHTEPSQSRLFTILAFIAALNAAIAGWYYLRVAMAMYLRTTMRPLENRRVVTGLAGLAACALLTLWFGVNPGILLRFVQDAVPTSSTRPATSVGQR